MLQIRNAAAGEDIGYNATARLPARHALRPSPADMLTVSAANSATRAMRHKSGLTAPIIGRVSMDTTIIDITDWPEDHAATGDYVDLIHDGYTADEMAQAQGQSAMMC